MKAALSHYSTLQMGKMGFQQYMRTEGSRYTFIALAHKFHSEVEGVLISTQAHVTLYDDTVTLLGYIPHSKQ